MTRVKHWLIGLAAVAFLIANTMGTHVHLCFDGQEPAASVHMMDGENADHHGEESPEHNDADLAVADQAPLVKAVKFELLGLTLSAVWLVAAMPLVELVQPVTQQAFVTFASLRFLIPPLRGPPL